MAAEPSVLLDCDLGDAEFVIRQHPDGMVTIDMSETRLVLNPEQFLRIVHGIVAVASEKGWWQPA